MKKNIFWNKSWILVPEEKCYSNYNCNCSAYTEPVDFFIVPDQTDKISHYYGSKLKGGHESIAMRDSQGTVESKHPNSKRNSWKGNSFEELNHIWEVVVIIFAKKRDKWSVEDDKKKSNEIVDVDRISLN